MDETSKSTLRGAMRELAEGLRRMEGFNFAGAHDSFVFASKDLQVLADKEKMNG